MNSLLWPATMIISKTRANARRQVPKARAASVASMSGLSFPRPGQQLSMRLYRVSDSDGSVESEEEAVEYPLEGKYKDEEDREE